MTHLILVNSSLCVWGRDTSSSRRVGEGGHIYTSLSSDWGARKIFATNGSPCGQLIAACTFVLYVRGGEGLRQAGQATWVGEGVGAEGV